MQFVMVVLFLVFYHFVLCFNDCLQFFWDVIIKQTLFFVQINLLVVLDMFFYWCPICIN